MNTILPNYTLEGKQVKKGNKTIRPLSRHSCERQERKSKL